MKYLSYILLLIFMPMSLFSQNIWEMTNGTIDDIPINMDIIDTNHINIFTKNDVEDNKIRIMNSTDQGKTWSWIYEGLYYEYPNFEYPNKLECIDSNHLFMGFKAGYMYYSRDAAKTIDTINIESLISYEDFAMYDTSIGSITNAYIVKDTSYLLITKDKWKTYIKFFKQDDSTRLSYSLPYFKNDSIFCCNVSNSRGKRGSYFGEFNINTLEYKLYWMGNGYSRYDLFLKDEKYIFTCGCSNILNGGSCHDAIFKSRDSGKTWRRVLDLYTDIDKFPGYDMSPFGLQSIAFKDSMTGIAVGQFGKILYTYDGGESWIYESKLHDSINQPATMKVRYAGTMPIIVDFLGKIFRLKEDNLAPKAEDTITISGRVWEGSRGQAGIPVRIGLRVTMTDSNGYYKFTRVAKGKHTVQAMNKYFDRNNPKYAYKPFDYTPLQYDLDLVSDTSGIDFNAIDLRTFYSVSGKILTKDANGLKDISLSIDDSTSTSISDGSFIFPKIESNRTFELKPNKKQYKFSPSSYSINIKSDLDTFKFIATPITDVYEKYESGITLKPNPAKDYIDIILDEKYDIKAEELKIIDIFGKEQISIKLINHSDSYRVKLDNLSSGVYFIRIGSRVEKFVKW